MVRLNGKTLREEDRISVPIPIAIYSSFYEDTHKNIWILGGSCTLAEFEPVSQQFDTFDFSATTGAKAAALSMGIDANQLLWIAPPWSGACHSRR